MDEAMCFGKILKLPNVSLFLTCIKKAHVYIDSFWGSLNLETPEKVWDLLETIWIISEFDVENLQEVMVSTWLTKYKVGDGEQTKIFF